jgi:hypothetical protein
VTARDWTMADVLHVVELSHIYDGWSIAHLRDGRVVNRWDPEEYPGRYAATELALAGMLE